MTARPGDRLRRPWGLAQACSLGGGLTGLLFGAVSSLAQVSSTSSGSREFAEGPNLTIEQSQLRERNPLRLRPEFPPTADSAWVSAAEGAYRHRWGRQQLLGFGRIAGLHYANEPRLTHDTYRFGAVANLETVGEFGARLNALRQRDALEGQLRLDPVSGQRRLQTLDQWGGSLLWGMRRRWTLQSDWQHENLQPNRPESWWPGYEQDTWRFQIRADHGNAWSWSLGRRQQEGTQKAVDTPLGRVAAVDYRMGVWDLEWSWQRRPGDTLTLRGSSGHGQRQAQAIAPSVDTNPGVGSSNASAIKSLLAEIRWQPTPALSVQAMVSRDRGQQTQATQSWINGEGLLLQGANDVRQARLALQWNPGPHWQLAITRQRMDRLGGQSWSWAEESSASPSLPNLSWRDRLDRQSLGITWMLSRRATAQCTVRVEARTGMGADGPRLPWDPHTLLWKDRVMVCGLRWQVFAPA